jgi:hypothetical protein
MDGWTFEIKALAKAQGIMSVSYLLRHVVGSVCLYFYLFETCEELAWLNAHLIIENCSTIYFLILYLNLILV